MKDNTQKLIDALKAMAGKCRFCSFTYTSKGRNETARYTMLIGADYGALTEKDITELEIRLQNAQGIEKAVLGKILASRKETLLAHAQERPHANDTKAGQYLSILPGLRMNTNDSTLEIFGTLETYTVITAGDEKKPVQHRSEETALKAKIEKELPRSKWKTICLENVAVARLNGETIELESILG